MTQRDSIITYLLTHGSITTAEAFSELGITRLSARMKEIIDSGVKITKSSEEVKNRYGETARVIRYYWG